MARKTREELEEERIRRHKEMLEEKKLELMLYPNYLKKKKKF